MTSPKPYIMFGVHPLFGDYVDAIHACGGYLERVVMNVTEPNRPEGSRFTDCLERYHKWLSREGSDHKVDVLWIEQYKPRQKEIPVLGFRGVKSHPLINKLHEKFGLYFPPLVHPTANVSPMAHLEEGAFIGAGSIVASNSRIGPFSLINRGVSIGHDVEVERSVVISPSACTASGVHLCQGSVVGIGATIIDNIVVGEGSYVAAGAVVTKDVPPMTLVAGVPAVFKKSL